jgi:hypothetical protein
VLLREIGYGEELFGAGERVFWGGVGMVVDEGFTMLPDGKKENLCICGEMVYCWGWSLEICNLACGGCGVELS